MTLAVRPPLAPMLAKLERKLPRSGFVYEPKWDGFRALVFRDGDVVDIRSRNDKRLDRYFPEIVEAVRALPERSLVLDGELVIPKGEGLDFAALMARLHPASSRVDELRRSAPAAFVAFDLVAMGERDVRGAPFAERRRMLAALFADRPVGPLLLTPSTEDPDVAATWLREFSSRGIDGVVAKSPAMPYSPGQRAMVKVKHERTADVVVAGLRLVGSPVGGAILGSLLLGLYGGEERFVHIGVVSQLTRARRDQLVRELAPLATGLGGHPWEHGFGLERSPLGRLKGSAGRWSPAEMDLDWIPLRPERVCEVAYDTIDGHRLRYPARFVRWRPDRDPASCGFDQIEGASGDVRAFLRP